MCTEGTGMAQKHLLDQVQEISYQRAPRNTPQILSERKIVSLQSGISYISFLVAYEWCEEEEELHLWVLSGKLLKVCPDINDNEIPSLTRQWYGCRKEMSIRRNEERTSVFIAAKRNKWDMFTSKSLEGSVACDITNWILTMYHSLNIGVTTEFLLYAVKLGWGITPARLLKKLGIAHFYTF